MSEYQPTESAEAWAAKVAALAVDVLVDAGLVSREKFETAAAIVSEEILVRLCCDDYPPSANCRPYSETVGPGTDLGSGDEGTEALVPRGGSRDAIAQ